MTDNVTVPQMPRGDEAAAILERVIEQELHLLDPAQRDRPDELPDLLRADFQDFSLTGIAYSRDEVGALALDDTSEALTIEELEAEFLAPTVVLVTYRGRRGERRSLRSSVWVLEGERWLLRHHQATPVQHLV